MHQSIVSYVEDYLDGRLQGADLEKFQSHVGSCRECYDLVMQMELQSALVRSLREVETLEPSPGFYGRVMRRIESEDRGSFWSLLLDPIFGRRLAYASGALAILMGVFLLATEPISHELTRTPVETLAQADTVYTVAAGAESEDLQADRDALLVTFATFAESE